MSQAGSLCTSGRESSIDTFIDNTNLNKQMKKSVGLARARDHWKVETKDHAGIVQQFLNTPNPKLIENLLNGLKLILEKCTHAYLNVYLLVCYQLQTHSAHHMT